MVNVLRILKSRPYKSSERANILFAVLLISVLSSGLVLHHTFSLKNNVYKQHVLMALYHKKRALSLAHLALDKLKSIANKDACTTHYKGKRFCFANDVFIEDTPSPHSGYRVDGEFPSKQSFACCFDRQGLRKPLSEFMTENNPLKTVINNDRWGLIQKRWVALHRNDPLPPFYFSPLIEKVEIFEENKIQWIWVYFFNPYDRELQSKMPYVMGINFCLSSSSIHLCTHSKAQKALFQILNDAKMIQFEIKHGHKYNLNVQTLGVLNFKITGTREGGYLFDTQYGDQQSAKPRKSKWGNCGKGGVAVTNSNNTFEPFSTKTWIDKLDACFFEYEEAEPYSKIGNFKSNSKAIPELRNYFWNEVVENLEADVFCFNGPRTYFEGRLRAYGIPEYQALKIAKEIVKHQPYPSATAFLERITTAFPEIKNYLHHFEHLSHRTEVFKIKSWSGEYTCEMLVQREARNELQRSWKIIYVHWNRDISGKKSFGKEI
ncbi:MAG: hypothetical protein ACSW8C_03700 [bacterium]